MVFFLSLFHHYREGTDYERRDRSDRSNRDREKERRKERKRSRDKDRKERSRSRKRDKRDKERKERKPDVFRDGEIKIKEEPIDGKQNIPTKFTCNYSFMCASTIKALTRVCMSIVLLILLEYFK